MNKRICCVLVLLVVGLLQVAQAKNSFERPDYQAICEQIATENLQHPYLFFTEAEKPALIEKIQETPHMKHILNMLTIQADTYMKVNADPDPVLNDMRTRFLGNDQYAANQGYFQRGAVMLALLYQLTGDEAYAERAYELAERLCQLDTWRMVAHCYDVIYDRVWPFGAEDDQVSFGYDIWTGDTAADMAMVYDWLYAALDKKQRDRIRSGLLDLAILRVRGNYEYQWWSSAYKCNWAGICYNGIGLASLSLLTENPELIDVVVRSCQGIEGMVSNITPEGGWIEGRHYSIYGLGQSMIFMDAIKRITDGKINLFKIDGLYNNPAGFALYGMGGTFGDGSFVDKMGGPIGSLGMFGKLITETGNTDAQYYIDNYLPRSQTSAVGVRSNSANSIWDLIWPMPTDVEAVKPTEASRHFTGIEWVAMRKDFGKQYAQVVAKCGPSDDPHHGHLDAGSFNVSWMGESFIGELPQRFYDQFFFNDCRWDYLDVRSLGHNVVLVDGEEQVSSKRKDQPWRDKGGKITAFESLPSYAYTQMDPTNAYDNTSLKGWQRTLILDKERNITLVLDRVSAEVGASIELLFHPTCTASVEAGVTSLQGTNAAMKMAHSSALPLTVTQEDQVDHRIFKVQPFVTIPCLFVRATSTTPESLFATIIYPDQQGEQVELTLDQSGKNPVLRYELSGEKLAYEITPKGVKQL